MKSKNDDSFLTCMNACATIHTMFGMPIEFVLANYGEVNRCFNDVLSTKLEDVPENMLKQYVRLRGDILAFQRHVERNRNANSNSGPWS